MCIQQVCKKRSYSTFLTCGHWYVFFSSAVDFGLFMKLPNRQQEYQNRLTLMLLLYFMETKLTPAHFHLAFLSRVMMLPCNIVSLHFRAIQRTLWSKTINQARKCFVSYYSRRRRTYKKDEWNTMIFPMEPTTNDWCQRFEQFWNEEIQPSWYL